GRRGGTLFTRYFRPARQLELDERRADLQDFARRTAEPDHPPRDRRRQLDGRLFRHDLRDDLILLDEIAKFDVPGEQLRFDRTLAEIGQLERIDAHAASSTRRMARSTRA